MAPDEKEESRAARSGQASTEDLERPAASQLKGLTSAEAAERLHQVGPNQVERETSRHRSAQPAARA